MLSYVGVVCVLAVACILFGILRADSSEKSEERSCEGCQESESCDHFSMVGFISQKCDKS